MGKTWTTLRMRVDNDTKQFVAQLAELEGFSLNKYLVELLNREVGLVKKLGFSPQSKGVPLLAQHKFDYVPERDCFAWRIDLGDRGNEVIGQDLSLSQLEHLRDALSAAINSREKFLRKGGTVVPKKLLNYKVIQDAEK